MAIKQVVKKYLYPLLNICNSPQLLKGIIHGTVRVGLSRLIDCKFEIQGKGSHVIIGDGCVLRGLHCLVVGDYSEVEIGNNVNINASHSFPTVMNAFDGTRIIIGDDCLFSNGVELHTTDYHSIVSDGARINPPGSIQIESHVWVGLRTIILKGAHIASDSVVGAGSIVTSSFNETNTIIAGNPAKVIKTNINWDIRNLPLNNK